MNERAMIHPYYPYRLRALRQRSLLSQREVERLFLHLGLDYRLSRKRAAQAAISNAQQAVSCCTASILEAWNPERA